MTDRISLAVVGRGSLEGDLVAVLGETREIVVPPESRVLDPMCGSGTTCKMAALHKRSYIGCDISKEYVGLTKERMRKVLK